MGAVEKRNDGLFLGNDSDMDRLLNEQIMIMERKHVEESNYFSNDEDQRGLVKDGVNVENIL